MDTCAGGITLLDRERRPERTGPLANADGVRIAGDVIDAATLWSCTTCMHCVEVCPVGVEHLPTIVQLRRALVDEGTMDSTLQQALQNLATQGNLLREVGPDAQRGGPESWTSRSPTPASSP